ncbi:hypothetical protein SISNIDRAFT_470796 [Sistotremastrum niveocremeum HHB9708]|uniref:F-box domain-containing protein n=1 Tax=Sistotremastrum niveocremeum HHB9708 TaxID=1314777 RepID=A0A164NF08_9AGAM|nr:hypothetical protein SISNIDRAFT_470796 [Sistotremastrum niveocremeum HHB9708]
MNFEVQHEDGDSARILLGIFEVLGGYSRPLVSSSSSYYSELCNMVSTSSPLSSFAYEMMRSLNLLTLPIELIPLIVRGASLRELYNLTRTCSQLYHLGRTSRQFWMYASDQDDLPLPTGHTIETVPVDQLIYLAARAISISDAMNQPVMKPKRSFVYASKFYGQTINMLGLPGNSWYIEHIKNTSRIRIKRAESGWNYIYLDLGISKTVHAFKLLFPDERKGPAPPIILNRQEIALSDRPFDLTLDDEILLAATSNRRNVRLANYVQKLGFILRFPDRLASSRGFWISSLSINKQIRKIIIRTANAPTESPESGRLIHKFHIANIPLDLLDSDDSPDVSQSSEIDWSERELEVTHAFDVPVWPSPNIVQLPRHLPTGAVHLADFNLSEEDTLEDITTTHLGSLFLCEDRLLAFHVRDLDSSGVDHFARSAGGASIVTGTYFRDSSKIVDLTILNAARTRVRSCHLTPPVARGEPYGIEAFNSLHGRMFIKSYRTSDDETSNGEVYYAVQY